MKLGSNDISAVKIGSTDVSKVYIGSTEVWSSFTGLLDTYTGASAAYSLRLLSSTYTGDAIEVRIDTTGQPTYDIGFVNGELDTATLEGYCTGGLDAFVTTWYDQSGNGRDATQSTASAQPQIVSSGSVITQGTKPAIYGDGSDDKLRYSTSSFPVTGDISFDIFLSENLITSGLGYSSSSICAQSYSNDRRTFSSLCNEGSANAVRLFGGNTIYNENNTGYRLANTNYQGGGGAINARVNGSDLTVNSFSNTGLNIQSATDIVLFSVDGQSFNESETYLQEAIFYFSDQSSNRSGIETNINDFYSIY